MIQYIKNAVTKWWILPFGVYVIPNILMCLFIIITDLLVVDNIPILLTASMMQVFLSIILVIGSFYFIKFTAIKFNKLALKYRVSHPGKILGMIVFLLQGLQLLVLLIFDFGRVGGVSTSSNYFVLLVSYLPADIIFLLYYGHHRSKGFPIFNFSIYILINLLQGWTGIWVIIIMIEFYHQLTIRSFGEAARKGSIILVTLLLLYPVINEFKYVIRGGEDYQKRTAVESIAELTNRLQHVSGVILIFQERDQLISAFNRNEITPYYLDNRLGTLFAYSTNRISLQRYLTVNYLIDKSLFTTSDELDEHAWFTNIGMAGWFGILTPFQMIFYIIFLVLMITLPFLLNHFFLKSLGLIPVLQTLSLIFAFHGWFTVQFSFISGIIIYIILFNLLKAKKEGDPNEALI